MQNVKAEVILSHIRGNWNHLKIIPTIHEQRIRKVRNQGTTEKSHSGRCAPTLQSTNVKVQNFCMGNNVIVCTTNCKQNSRNIT